MVEAVYNDGVAEINGREYVFNKSTHKNRLAVFAYSTKIQRDMQAHNFGFMGDKEWEDIVKIIQRIVTFEGSSLNKLPNHWEKYPEDYLQLMPVALGVISFPFMRGNNTG